MGLGIRSVSFQPKPLNPKANERDADPVVRNAVTRALRLHV